MLNNEDLNQVTWEQRAMIGDPKFEGSQDLPPFNYAAFARMVGLEGIRVEKPEEIDTAFKQAMEAHAPVVVDVVTDPSVPPLPPHITLEQAKAFTSAILKRDVNAWDMVKQAYKDAVETYLPHGG